MGIVQNKGTNRNRLCDHLNQGGEGRNRAFTSHWEHLEEQIALASVRLALGELWNERRERLPITAAKRVARQILSEDDVFFDALGDIIGRAAQRVISRLSMHSHCDCA